MIRFRWTAVAFSVALVAAGCSSTKTDPVGSELVWGVSSGDVSIATEVAKMWTAGDDGKLMTADDRGPKVRIESLPRSTDDQHHLLTIELNAHLSGFDVLSLDVIWTGEFAQNGWLTSLEELRPRLQPLFLQRPFESATWQGRLWAAPYVTGAAFLYYRKDLVKVVPKTWDDLVKAAEAAQEVTRAGGNRVPIIGSLVPLVGQTARYEGLVVNYLEYFWGAGGELLDDSGTKVLFGQVGEGQEIKDTPAWKALDFMKTRQASEFYGPDYSRSKEGEALTAFMNGQAIFMRNWTDNYQKLTTSKVKDVFGIAPLPTFAGQGTISALGGTNLGVSRFSDNTKAAKDFVTFVSTSPKVQRYLAENRYPPALASVYKEMAADKVMALLSPEPGPDQPGVLRYAKSRPPVPAWSAISDEIQQQVFSAYTGQVTPEDAVKAIRSFMEVAVRR